MANQRTDGKKEQTRKSGSPDDDLKHPHSIDTEKMVLGAVLMDPEAFEILAETLDGDDFYRSGHQTLFAVMAEIVEAGKSIDFQTLVEELNRRGAMEAVGGPSYLASLMDGLPRMGAKHLGQHAEQVKEYARLRKAIQAGRRLIQEASGQTARAAEIATETAETLYDIGGAAMPGKPVLMRELVSPGMTALEQAYERRHGVTGLPTGLRDLDEMTAGMHPGDFIIIAARTSIGKTALALKIAENVAKKRVALVFSLEMDRQQLFVRMLSAEAKVDSQRLRTGRLIDSDWGKIAHAIGALSELKLVIDDTPGIGLREIRARARQVKAEYGDLAVIVVDYIQLMRGRGRFDTRAQEVGSFSRGLKAIAKEMQVPLIGLAQVNRSPEAKDGRKARKPGLSDLRESGDLESDADVVLIIWRPEPTTDESGIVKVESLEAEIIIAKQRNGPQGRIPIKYTSEYVRFDDAEA